MLLQESSDDLKYKSQPEIRSILQSDIVSENLNEVLTTLKSEIALHQKQAKTNKYKTVKWIGIGTISILILAVVFHLKGLLNIFTYVGIFASWTAATKMSKGYRQAVTRVANFDDPRLIGPMIEAYNNAEIDLRNQLQPILTDLIHKHPSTERQFLSIDQRRAIDGILTTQKRWENVRFFDALVDLLKQNSDANNLWVCEKFVKDNKTYNEVKRLKEALPEIKLAVESTTSRDTLLRAAHMPEQPETLLRPASAVLDTHGETLLKAVE